MKLLLIDPPELFLRGDGLTRQVQPLGLAYVGAAVADLADVRFLLPDTRLYLGSDPWAELAATIAAKAPDVAGITAVPAMMPAAAEGGPDAIGLALALLLQRLRTKRWALAVGYA